MEQRRKKGVGGGKKRKAHCETGSWNQREERGGRREVNRCPGEAIVSKEQ